MPTETCDAPCSMRLGLAGMPSRGIRLAGGDGRLDGEFTIRRFEAAGLVVAQ